ncbi:fatty-acid amide hydrolase 2-like isoform X2 [Cydia pomonella]|nr:fatty-acid amide hydrolase 2-like isoform X2 [Cydia pomonella]XP_061718145.1 fatty-acid amide hydrolase 2-like isoform X2 [Cydia pomonella]XP_061718146.1 fatty-acid amide hydrolase 2-like isoform X2 [Cydia pomonella]
MANTTLKCFFTWVWIVLDKIIDLIFGLYWESKKQFIADLSKKHAFLAESAVSLAKKIKEKQLKSEDLVKAVIERIKEVNPIINAVTEDRFEAAIADAREVDKLITSGLSEEEAAKKPFLGVPFTTKESQSVKGYRYTLGLWWRRELRADEDSESVALLKAAGAILVALTNVPELLVWPETRNPVYGMTNNPHHTGRSPGGSSGAEAALTACYATPISLCSDVGGSIRMPAFYCGMFGHHNTPGTTSIRGVIFHKGDEESMISLGFITKHVEDLAPLNKVIAGNKAPLLKLDRKVDIKDIQFYYMEKSKDYRVTPIKPELRSAMANAVAKISEEVSLKNSPQPYYHKGFDHMYQLWTYWMSQEPHNFAGLLNNSKTDAIWIVELLRKILGLSKHGWSAIIWLLHVQLMPLFPNWAEKLTKEWKEDLLNKLGDNGVLLLPSAPQTAPYHYSCFLQPFNFSYWAAVNVLKCPATQVPMGVNSQGLPIGIQVMATPYNDALCLTVAKYLEKQFGGAVMACKT